MSGLTIQVTVSTIAGIIDLVGNAARRIVLFALEELVHKCIEVKLIRHGRARIDGRGFQDFYKILIFSCGILLALLPSLAIFFIEPQRRLDGIRPVTVQETVLCTTESPDCKPLFIYFFNTSGSNLSETIVRWPVVGGLLNAEENVSNFVVTSLDCSVITRPGQFGGGTGQCDTDLMTNIGHTYDEENVVLRRTLSNVSRIGFRNVVFLADVQTSGQFQPPIRTRKLCVTDQSKAIEYCGVWFHREGTREILASCAHKLSPGYNSCNVNTETCEIGKIYVNRNTAVILRHYDGLARMVNLSSESYEFFDMVTEILITRDMVMTRAVWDLLELTNSKVVNVTRNATDGTISEDTLITVRALGVLGLFAAMLLIALVMLFMLYLTQFKRTTKYPLYDFAGVTHSLLRSVPSGGRSEGKHEEESKCFERSSLPLYLTMTKVPDKIGKGHIESYRDPETEGVSGMSRKRDDLE